MLHRLGCLVTLVSAACVPQTTGGQGPSAPSAGPASGAPVASASAGRRDPTDLPTAGAILDEVYARQHDGREWHTVTGDLAKERAAIEQSKADLAAIAPTFETKVWNEPAAGNKAQLRALWRAEKSYLDSADVYLALLEAFAAAKASPTEPKIAALEHAIELGGRMEYRGDLNSNVDQFMAPQFKASIEQAKEWIAATPSVESNERRAAVANVELAVTPEGVITKALPIADERIGAVVTLSTGTLTTVRARLVLPADDRGHANQYRLVECEKSANYADRCPAVEMVNQFASIAVQGTRELRVIGPKGTVYLQVFAKGAKYPLSAVVVGAPPETASLAERDVARWGLNRDVVWGDYSWSQASELFTTLPKTFIVYAKVPIKVSRDMSSGEPTTIAAGEPLLIEGEQLCRANGGCRSIELTNEERHAVRSSGKSVFEGVVTSEPPTKLVLPAPNDPSEPSFYLSELVAGSDTEELYGLTDKRVNAYMAARTPVVNCVANDQAKNGTGSGYDLVTYDANGHVQSVKSASSVFAARVEAKCNVRGLTRKLEALRKALRGDALQAIRKRLSN